jgi:hypothetical protein
VLDLETDHADVNYSLRSCRSNFPPFRLTSPSHPPEEFFTRVLQDIRQFSKRVAFTTAAGVERWPLRMFYGDSTRALLRRAFVPLIVAAALVNGWINTALLKYVRANPAVTAALCAIAFAALIGWIISQISLVRCQSGIRRQIQEA